MRTRTRGAAWGAAVLAVGLTAGPATGVAGAAPERSSPGTGGTGFSVTLITGDRVVVTGDGARSVQAGPGRANTAFTTFERDGHLHVVPNDTLGALAGGRLDPRLFDVTGLRDAGYDDARRDTLPLVVTRAGDARPRAAAGVHVTRDLPAAGAVAAQAVKAEAATAYRALVDDPAVRKVWLDGVRKQDLDRSTAQIDAPAAWEAGYTGAGVKVAVLDGGVDGDHPDLAGSEVAERNFTDDPDATDLDGHGTHVAATVAGSGSRYRGVAPDAQILDGKVCSQGGCAESWILDGMQWAVEQGADVVNLSLGGTDGPEVDPLEEAVGALSASSGALFVIAAGNSGRPGSVGSPGSAEAALTVGAVERDDDIASFSSRGPRVGDGGVKPDITAPGVDIVAAKAARGVIGTPVGDGHVALSGTSMATPHVAGAAALLAQRHPDWTGARIKAGLMASAKANPELTAFDQGAGRVDLAKAITAAVVADPPSLSFGSQPWPHDDDTPVTKQLTLHNTGPRAVTAPVTVEATGPDGKPAPAGLFTAEPATATIPAGGRATVTVTADTRAGALDGAYSGAVVVGDALRAPIGVDREQESYDITTRFVDATGGKPFAHSGVIIGLDNAVFTFLDGDSGAVTTRLPKGEYAAQATVVTGDEENPAYALLPRPSLSVTKAETVVFDARAAKPVEVTAPVGARPSPTSARFGGQDRHRLGVHRRVPGIADPRPHRSRAARRRTGRVDRRPVRGRPGRRHPGELPVRLDRARRGAHRVRPGARRARPRRGAHRVRARARGQAGAARRHGDEPGQRRRLGHPVPGAPRRRGGRPRHRRGLHLDVGGPPGLGGLRGRGRLRGGGRPPVPRGPHLPGSVPVPGVRARPARGALHLRGSPRRRGPGRRPAAERLREPPRRLRLRHRAHRAVPRRRGGRFDGPPQRRVHRARRPGRLPDRGRPHPRAGRLRVRHAGQRPVDVPLGHRDR
ncbi:S8 family serine peptidase [Saccharothrix sp. MB29]|nr:S8 family serine peptidase [Saccharothrix sp. MB29]